MYCGPPVAHRLNTEWIWVRLHLTMNACSFVLAKTTMTLLLTDNGSVLTCFKLWMTRRQLRRNSVLHATATVYRVQLGYNVRIVHIGLVVFWQRPTRWQARCETVLWDVVAVVVVLESQINDWRSMVLVVLWTVRLSLSRERSTDMQTKAVFTRH